MATLTIQLPGMPSVSHVLKDDTVTVGRMKGNNIVIDDASVSLTHARITRHEGQFYLKDLNSTNGTIVNGQPIKEARLRDQDRVRFADISAHFEAEVATEAAAAIPAPAPIPSPKSAAPPAPAPVPIAATTPAPPAAVTSTRPASAPRREITVGQLVARLISGLGGAVAVGVIGVLGWKMLHGGFDMSSGSPDSESPSVALARAKPIVEVPKQALVAVPNPSVASAAPAAQPNSPKITPAEAGNQTVAQLALALRDPDPAERRRAATALHSLGAQAKEGAAALHAALDDTDQDVRMWAALTLVNNELHDKATIPILIGVLQRENPVLRQVACLSLGLIPYEDYEKNTVVPALTETASKDGDDEVRKAAVSALNIIAPDAALKAGVK